MNERQQKYFDKRIAKYKTDKSFVFTPEAVAKIEKISKLFIEKDAEIVSFWEAFKERNKDFIDSHDDLMYEVIISCFSSIDTNVEEGDSICSFEMLGVEEYFDDKTDIPYDDWNLLHNHPELKYIKMTYTMHCLCEHTDLTWQQIIDIDEIWWDFKIDFQRIVEFKS
ncbi:MAG: hypothetical protein WCK02_02495 [Bacteroidota bacterium]